MHGAHGEEIPVPEPNPDMDALFEEKYQLALLYARELAQQKKAQQEQADRENAAETSESTVKSERTKEEDAKVNSCDQDTSLGLDEQPRGVAETDGEPDETVEDEDSHPAETKHSQNEDGSYQDEDETNDEATTIEVVQVFHGETGADGIGSRMVTRGNKTGGAVKNNSAQGIHCLLVQFV